MAVRQIGFQDLGVLADPLIAAGYEIRYHDAFTEDPRRIAPTEPDVIVVLGGPYGVGEGATHLFIDSEIDMLRTRLRARRPTFGICLGAQLMARALDAAVRPGAGKEIGWKSVALSEAGRAGPLADLANLPVLHWHGDTFDLPNRAVRLASTPMCANQAFALGLEILAVQFHLEVDPRQGMKEWIAYHEEELHRERIDTAELVAAARTAAGMDRSGVPAMFAKWLAHLA